MLEVGAGRGRLCGPISLVCQCTPGRVASHRAGRHALVYIQWRPTATSCRALPVVAACPAPPCPTWRRRTRSVPARASRRRRRRRRRQCPWCLACRPGSMRVLICSFAILFQSLLIPGRTCEEGVGSGLPRRRAVWGGCTRAGALRSHGFAVVSTVRKTSLTARAPRCANVTPGCRSDPSLGLLACRAPLGPRCRAVERVPRARGCTGGG